MSWQRVVGDLPLILTVIYLLLERYNLNHEHKRQIQICVDREKWLVDKANRYADRLNKQMEDRQFSREDGPTQ